MSLKMDILRSSFQSADIQKLKFPAFTSGRPETFGKDDADTNVLCLVKPCHMSPKGCTLKHQKES